MKKSLHALFIALVILTTVTLSTDKVEAFPFGGSGGEPTLIRCYHNDEFIGVTYLGTSCLTYALSNPYARALIEHQHETGYTDYTETHYKATLHDRTLALANGLSEAEADARGLREHPPKTLEPHDPNCRFHDEDL